MEKLNITSTEIENYEIIGQGQEGIIYRLPNKKVVLKAFNADKWNENKSKKIELLHDDTFRKIITIPEKKTIIDGEENGYTMEYMQGYNEFSVVKSMPIGKKMKYLRRLRQMLDVLHRKDVYVKDLRCRNILIKDDDIKLCDVDNFQINGLEEDILNIYAREFYLYHRKDNEELDTFALNLLTLEILNDHNSDQIRSYLKQYMTLDEIKDDKERETAELYCRFMYGKDSYKKVILDSSDITKYIKK